MRVTRQRRQPARSGFSWHGRPARIAVAGLAAVAVTGGGLSYANTASVFGNHLVGSTTAAGTVLASDQVIKPLGDRLLTQTGKIMSSTVSPDGRYLAATSTDKSIVLQIFDLKTYKLIFTVGSAATANQKLSDGTVGQEGPTYSPDGKFLWLPESAGIRRFPVNADGTLGTPTNVPIPAADGHAALVGATAYSPDGSTLYAAVNGQNTVVAIDPSSGDIKQTWNVGIAPRDLTFVGKKLYVSNEGGRMAKPGETTMDSYGTAVPADPYKGTSTTGTLSVINPAKKQVAQTINVGLHPTALYAAGKTLFVANTDDDSVSVVDTRKGKVVQTISTKPWNGSKVGYEPNAITLTSDGHLLVTLGRANAVAVYKYEGDPQQPVRYIGLLPTDYFPAEVATVGDQIVVTNTRGIGSRGPELTFNTGQGTNPATGHGTHATTASLTRFTLPNDRQIANKYTNQVFKQNGWTSSDAETAKKGQKAKPVPVPAKIGDPSTIKHVFLIVKENRTYDQVYGDIPEGNGEASDAQFGKKVTPNQHALAKQFGLYDNFYDVGTNSAEGHNWLMEGDNPEYTESSAGEYTRSYQTNGDVLGHQRSGFLWTSVEDAGNTAKTYGEFDQFLSKPAGATWQKYYCATKDVLSGGDPAQLTDPSLKINESAAIPSLDAITDHDFPQFDTSIPDIYRAQLWKQDFEKNGPANLNMFWLSSDHTGGTADPEAQVADGDLAVGQIVDEISHSKYWKDSAIFVVEDDSQAGADHVDGHRAPIQVISPWAKHGKVISTYNSQITMVRTIQQILGAQPLNQKVAAATPMTSAFTSKPDYTPFTAVPNQVPLTEGVATAPACGTDTLGTTGAAAKKVNAAAAKKAAVPEANKAIVAAWKEWATKQHFTGEKAIPDYAHPEQMNRYTWYQTHSWTTPYPGDSKIYKPNEVPGAAIPSGDSDH